MPLHQWYIPRGLYTAEEKAKIAAEITEMYYQGPVRPQAAVAKLLVEVQFFELDKTDRFVSGEPSDNQVQIRIFHVARLQETNAGKMRFTERIERLIKPYIQDRGLTWEVQVADEDQHFWRIGGLIPPYVVNDKEGAELWYRTNKALPY